MHARRFLPATAILFSLSVAVAAAQTRDIRGGRIFLDDGGSEGVLIVAPSPMPGGSAYTLTLPASLPPSGFFLTGDGAGNLTAANPFSLLDSVSWLLTGNAGTSPLSDFIGTTDSTDLSIRTNNSERLRITALGHIGLGTAAPVASRLHVVHTFPDTAADDPLFGFPLMFGIRSEAAGPASTFAGATYVSSGNLMYLQGTNDLSAGNSFHGNVGLVLNRNTGGSVNEMIGAFGLAMQVDPASSVANGLIGVHGEAQPSEGTAGRAVGVLADINADNGAVTDAYALQTRFEIAGSGTITNGYGLYLGNPQVDASGTLTNYTALHLQNLDSGQLAMKYDGSGSNAPLVLEWDGDLGVGTSTPGEARLHVARTFADSVSPDLEFGIPLTMGVRTDVSSPAQVEPGAVYVGAGSINSLNGSNDLSTATQFVGQAGLVRNGNTGGAVPGLLGTIGQVMQTDAASNSQNMTGVQGQAQILDGTVTDAVGVAAAMQVSGGSVSTLAAVSTSMNVSGTASVTEGFGLEVRAPNVDPGAALTDYTGLHIGNLTDGSYRAIFYEGTGGNGPFVVEGDGDVGIGTTGIGDARLRVSRTFDDSVLVDPLFGEQLAFGIRTDVSNPSVAAPGAVYVGSGSVSLLDGASDMSSAETFVGAAGLSVNRNTGGTVNAMAGLVGQSVQENAGSSSGVGIGVIGELHQSEGAYGTGVGMMARGAVDGGSITTFIGLESNLELDGIANVTRGMGLHIADPQVGAGASLGDFTGIRIENLTGGGTNTAFRYDGFGPNAPFVVQADGDIGAGVGSPMARLDVANSDALEPALQVSNANATGVGLEVTDGRVILSYDFGAPATIPSDVAVYSVDDGTGASVPVVALPTSAADGQMLYVYILDPDGATVGGTARASGDSLIYIYAGGGWRLFSVN